MKYNEQKGDLFNLDGKYALAHCISLDCAMGAGIAVAFDQKFKGMKNECKRHLDKYGASVPNIYMFEGIGGRIVFNLITKKVYYGKPTYQTITKCIEMMREHCEHYSIKYLAMPKIGCGLDKLQWERVKEIIKTEFAQTDIEIEVRYL